VLLEEAQARESAEHFRLRYHAGRAIPATANKCLEVAISMILTRGIDSHRRLWSRRPDFDIVLYYCRAIATTYFAILLTGWYRYFRHSRRRRYGQPLLPQWFNKFRYHFAPHAFDRSRPCLVV